MDWFFVDNIGKTGDTHLIIGEDAVHITKSLRMSVGEFITLCDSQKNQHLCKIERINSDGVLVRILSEEECQNEPTAEVTLFAALTKGDKLETVIQKSVELGVRKIIPVITDRCISRPDEKSAAKKVIRYQKIAEQAAMQSQRAVIPEVMPIITLKKAAEKIEFYDCAILFYEGGGQPLRELISEDSAKNKNIAVFTGPEGGFEESEVLMLKKCGAKTATLGKRILRAETAPIAALSAIMFHTHNLE